MLTMADATHAKYVVRLYGERHVTEGFSTRRMFIDTFPMRKCQAEALVEERELILTGRSRKKLPYATCGAGKVVKVE